MIERTLQPIRELLLFPEMEWDASVFPLPSSWDCLELFHQPKHGDPLQTVCVVQLWSGLWQGTLTILVCQTCWPSCHFQFARDLLAKKWGRSGRMQDWKLVLFVWQLHSSGSNAKCNSYLHSMTLCWRNRAIYMQTNEAEGSGVQIIPQKKFVKCSFPYHYHKLKLCTRAVPYVPGC